MIDRAALLADLRKQVGDAEADLDRQLKALPQIKTRLHDEWDRARKLGRTAATETSWRDERVTQVAVAWVLGTVFVRFCEDNELIAEPYLTGPDDDRREHAQARYDTYVDTDPDPTYRGWIERAFAELGAGQAGKLLFDPAHNPLYQIPLSHEGARDLIEFWRTRDAAGVLVHDFTDPLDAEGVNGWDTRFLGDLYQDLSEAARKNYALLQTPVFVEELILDRTLEPAIREFGYEKIEMIDPTCGSGHFVLGTFQRLVKYWADDHPTLDRHERIRAALDSVHGVDINPFAIAIARFRLLVAAMAAVNIRTLANAAGYEWPIHLAVGDSLIKARQLELTLDGERTGDPLAEHSYATEDVHEFSRILEPGRYHVVVGNPPYITVKDKKLNELYRDLYDACAGTYALSVPFAQRFFELAKRGIDGGSGHGRIGQITSNSYMKREFGTKLIEEFFAHKVELTEVIDTSGAYIPGHGTPTVILVGTCRTGSARTSNVRTVRSVQGEPKAPEKAEEGLVWKAIVNQIDSPGSASEWVSVDDLDRHRYFSKQPWILLDGGLEMVEKLEQVGQTRLADLTQVIGRYAHTGNDAAFFAAPGDWERNGVQSEHIVPLVEGEAVRDWRIDPATEAIFPYRATLRADLTADVEPLLWRLRVILAARREPGGTHEEVGLTWYEWSRWHPERFSRPLGIAFAFVATHNHFVLDRGSKVFKQSAPVIKLPEAANEEDHLGILGLLNSSVACFWLKMVSHNKGGSGMGRGFQDQDWEHRFEFTSTNLEEFPLPSGRPVSAAAELDLSARRLASLNPRLSLQIGTPTASQLRQAGSEWVIQQEAMIGLQEELDWQIYPMYGLCHESLVAPKGTVPGLRLGERAFEIVLARRLAAGEASDDWFKRHNSAPTTDIPAHWPETYRKIVQRRIDTIESNRAIGMIERPEYKRRWAAESWDALQSKALRSWLLSRMESRTVWFDVDDRPGILTLSQLTYRMSQDDDFTSVAALYAPRVDLATVVADLITAEHVPYLPALRYKPSGLKKRSDWEQVWDLQRQEDAAPDQLAKRKIRDTIPTPPIYTSADFLRTSFWQARGKLDVPKERFISYGSANVSTPELYGWAGWDHREQAQALATYFTNAKLTREQITPFLAGLLELQPWLTQWHNDYDDAYSGSPAAFFAGYRQTVQGDHGLTDDDLRNWAPAKAPAARRKSSKRAAVTAEGE